ncbi:MAG TPA: hypothetical protein VK894_09175, partial [Jiangellales bacterium]|nr:hypothetical protein [Jiangellales bacterium]
MTFDPTGPVRSAPDWGMGWARRHAEPVLLTVSLLLIAAGASAALAGDPGTAAAAWTVGTLLGVAMATCWLIESVRERRLGVDVIALLALAGALAVGEPLAGAVITLMLATGRVLEARAEARARRDLALLVERAPRTARRATDDGGGGRAVQEVAVEQVVRGDRLVVGSGEVVPVDGRLVDPAVLDESMLTGEPAPVDRPAGDQVRSGSVNA